MILQDLDNHIEMEDNNEVDFFDSPWTTIVRTFAMFVGELDFSDIPIDPTKTFSVVSYFFFLIFVEMMVVILMNLLNGLAVADVGEIVRDAKVVSIKSRYQIIEICIKKIHSVKVTRRTVHSGHPESRNSRQHINN